MSFQWNDKEPIYLQLKDQIRDMILSGDLQEGDSLPSVRQVAMDYKVNPITVSKSYQILVEEELVEKKRGLGMFVQEGAVKKLQFNENEQFINEDWPKILTKIKHLNVDTNQLINSLKEIGSNQ
ncbi:GntR family transcriptional regulator [Marinicella sp. S1101]|uniref:GntR family transcriptional regulator n=1 Tax=Marinicella marina TaxID=2996016 RepID=UPI002260E324|nr:GntR family transcriptional regulator [Marinicella marina]MCX7552974.1 GntR family transcriptional regulator [Marinicella marina]MDJ1139716.1 GntR family transcriptional regulator [Marinicella marina]